MAPAAGDVVLGLLLPVRQDLYALPIDAVGEVLELGPATPLTALPGAAGAILGLVNVRGQVLPVLDTAALLGLAPLRLEERKAMVVVRAARGVAALAATAMPRTELLGEELGSSTMATASGLHRVGRQVAALFDLEALLAPERVG